MPMDYSMIWIFSVGLFFLFFIKFSNYLIILIVVLFFTKYTDCTDYIPWVFCERHVMSNARYPSMSIQGIKSLEYNFMM